MKIKLIKTIIGFYIFVLAMSIGIPFTVSSKFSKEGDDILKLYSSDFSDGTHDMSYRLLKKGESKTNTYTTQIDQTRLPITDDNFYSLVICGLSAQGYMVEFNGVHIGTAGDPIRGRSNIWNTMYRFDIDKSLVSEHNTLQIKTYSEYEAGDSKKPIIITTDAFARQLLNSYGLLIDRIIDICLGFILFSVFIIVHLYVMSRKTRPEYLYFGIGLLLTTCICADFTNIISLPCSYLVYKKITVLTGFLSIASFSMGFSKYFNNRMCHYAGIILAAGATLITAFSSDMVTYKLCYNFFCILNIPVFLLWLTITIRHFKKSDAAKVLLASSCFLVIFGSYNMFALVFAQYFYLSSPSFYQFLIAIVPILFVVLDNQEKNELMETQKNQTAAAYVASLTDRMTGLCNHYCIVTMLNTYKAPFYLIVIDVDNFKEINDTRGHLAGDAVIKYLAKKMKECYSDRDVLCRYGGDEFIIVHFGKSLEDVLCKLNGYRESIKSVPIGSQEAQEITISCGIYHVAENEDVSTIIHRADIAMYHSKKQGKDRVSVYSADM